MTQDAPASPPRGDGRRLDAAVTAAITGAVVAELVEHGYGRFSMTSVARRAGTGKAALYRRWPNQEQMILDLLETLAVPAAEVDDHGSLGADLRAFLDSTGALLRDRALRQIIGELLAESLRRPALGAALRRSVMASRRETAARMLQRAAARGEIDGSVGAEVALDLLAGPVVVRLFTSADGLDGDYLEQLHPVLLRALTAPASTTGTEGPAR